MIGGRVYFFDSSPVFWSSDGTQEGTQPIPVLRDETELRSPAGLVAFGQRLLILERNGWLWPFDTEAQTVERILETSNAVLPVIAEDRFYASVWRDGRRSLWVGDGTGDGSSELFDFGIQEFCLLSAASIGRRLFFHVRTPGLGCGSNTALWHTDGTREGTREVHASVRVPPPGRPGAVTDRQHFFVSWSDGGAEIWATDGSAPGTRPIVMTLPGLSGFLPSNELQVLGDRLVFIALDEPGEGDASLWSVGISPNPFLRGDCNDDGSVDISDAVSTLGSLFLGQGEATCDDACDSNDDGTVDISDAVATLGLLFLGEGPVPRPGTEACGVDPTADNLDCATSSNCP